MRNYNRITPEGTKDLLLEECLVRRETEEKIRSVFQSQGYDELVTPGLEFFDVFQSEAVQYPQEQLYKLTDSKGRLIVLRPESTAPIARVVATRLREAMLPQRLCYMQTAYRFEPALKGRSDEFMQAGAELIGSDSYMADLEMASMAIDVLTATSKDSIHTFIVSSKWGFTEVYTAKTTTRITASRIIAPIQIPMMPHILPAFKFL